VQSGKHTYHKEEFAVGQKKYFVENKMQNLLKILDNKEVIV